MLELPPQLIEQQLRRAVGEILPEADVTAVLVRPCPDPQFGDYQTSGLMSLAKAWKQDPRQLAEAVLARMDAGEWVEKGEVAGAGFLNFKLKQSALSNSLLAATRGAHLFFAKTESPRTIVIDFSSPNVAKQMHVGHIRSTILGDCLARTLKLLGHRVITDNHIGDWGTQFGMLLLGWKTMLDRVALQRDAIAELERLYKIINERCGDDEKILEQARQELVRLQNGHRENINIWREMTKLSRRQFDEVYARLGVKFDFTYGESHYRFDLGEVVDVLIGRGIARESEGAKVVFFEDTPQMKEHPLIICKRDGGFNYATTDLATLAFRHKKWQPDEIVYVTDARQQLHFQQVFAAFRRWHPEAKAKLSHIWFGSVLGVDGRPLRTRSGGTVRLSELLDEAEGRAFEVVAGKNPTLSYAERREIARIIGIGAVKYADLLTNRQNDYVFSWDKMLALNGNTAPYLQYAYTRIRSIFARGGIQDSEFRVKDMRFTSQGEVALAKHLLDFGLTLEAVAEDYRPNYLCGFLYDLARLFTRFYETCPVLKAGAPARALRLSLCNLTARVLKQGLALLGIETLERM
jgi:arginyl-tRNA synthetase